MNHLLQMFLTRTYPFSAPLDFIIRMVQGQLNLPPFRLRDVGPTDFEATGEDVENYLRELARLLRESGRALITCFLLNEAQQLLAQQGKNDIHFNYGPGLYRTRNEAIPESAFAYEENFLIELIQKCGLEISGPIYYGAWSGRSDGLSYQDILLVQRSPRVY